MYHILCYGDSNTYGANPEGGRFDESIRWPKLLEQMSEEEISVAEDGLCGRTTVFEDSFTPHLRGIELLQTSLTIHQPVELVILMLGTNDMMEQHGVGPKRIAFGMERLVQVLRNPLVYQNDILVVSPVWIRDSITDSPFREEFGGLRASEMSRQLAGYYEKLAGQYHCYFLDAARYAQASDFDAIHMDAEGHRNLAAAMKEKVEEIIRKSSR